MTDERIEEVGQDIGETAEALDRLLSRQPKMKPESPLPGGVPNSPDLPSGNGEAAGQPPPSPQADPQPAEEPELVPVGEFGGGMLDMDGTAPAGEANHPDPVGPAKKRTRKAKKGTAQNPKDGTVGELEEGPTAQSVQNVQSGLAGGEARDGGGDAGPENAGQDHPGELVVLEPPVWGELSRANDEAGQPPAEEEPQGVGLTTIYDYTDEDLIKMGTDKLLELAGITTVDLTDAKDYEQIRGAKLVTIEKLQHALANTQTTDLELLAKISQKLGQLEKAKMEVIQLKLGGKPGDRTKPGTKLRARIGIASTGADGRSVVELEVEGK